MSKIVDITNAVRSTRFAKRLGSLLGLSHNDDRDLYAVYGYPLSLSGTGGFEAMYAYSRRQGIANRLTWGHARTCWRDGFTVRADVDDAESVQLVDELATLERAGFFAALERSDILNRIGRFSVTLVGVADRSESLADEIGTMRPADLDLCYFRAYAYDSVDVLQRETRKDSPRFDLPTVYQLYQASARDESEKSTTTIATRLVHWSRIVHWNENELDNNIEGMGALEPVFNRILDLDKTCGGSAEAYFPNARGKIAYEIDKDFASQLINDPVAKEAFDAGAQKFTNDQQDHTMAIGAKVHGITTPHYTPKDTILGSLWEVCAQTGFPIRVLTGEGGGQYTGEADQLAYNQLVADRQRAWCGPQAWKALGVIASTGAITLDPSWSVVFNQQKATTEKDQADLDGARAKTLQLVAAALSSIGGDSLDARSVLDALGLTDVKINDGEGEDLRDDDNA